LLLLLAALTPASLVAQTTLHFADLSLEELMNETITSVSKREQKLSDTAAAVTVLSNDELRRSGAVHLADALRLVPGLNVSSVNSNEWAVSSRGFNNVFSNKLLVLIDGRAVYSPLFAGVHWDSLQMLLEDVDRVEVIRGPGSTVWGANAVNGVINVVTRDARETQGTLIQARAGDLERAGGALRHGGRIDEKTFYRVHAGAFARNDFDLPDGRSAGDGWQGRHGGIRIDHHPADDSKLTWEAGATGVETARTDAHTIHTLARLTKDWSERSGFEVQLYLDQVKREDSTRLDARIDTIDLSAQHSFGLGERHDITWGLGYRFARIHASQTTDAILVRTDEIDARLASLFVQDEFHLVPDRLSLTGGVKLEHNSFSGVEVQPGARLAYKPTARQTLWLAATRAVRTASAIDGTDAFAMIAGPAFPGPGGGLYVPRLVGNDEVRSEVLWATELGYRFQPRDNIHVDVATFYNRYTNLVTIEGVAAFVPGPPGSPGTAEMPFVNEDGAGETRGAEIAVTTSPTAGWRLAASYSFLLVDLPGDSSPYERSAPRHQAVLRSSHEITRRIGIDAQLRYVDNLQSVPSYVTADLRLAYLPDDTKELALVGRNLLQDSHPEQTPFFLTRVTEVPRSIHAQFTWRF
jgi:iron complex outermembrane receptor protein